MSCSPEELISIYRRAIRAIYGQKYDEACKIVYSDAGWFLIYYPFKLGEDWMTSTHSHQVSLEEFGEICVDVKKRDVNPYMNSRIYRQNTREKE